MGVLSVLRQAKRCRIAGGKLCRSISASMKDLVFFSSRESLMAQPATSLHPIPVSWTDRTTRLLPMRSVSKTARVFAGRRSAAWLWMSCVDWCRGGPQGKAKTRLPPARQSGWASRSGKPYLLEASWAARGILVSTSWLSRIMGRLRYRVITRMDTAMPLTAM